MSTQEPQNDTLYAQAQTEVARFIFDERVVQVFPDMINRSVPGYSTILLMIGELAARYAQAHSRCYDLGCSLGGASFAMAKRIQAPGVDIHAIDSSPAMINRFAQLLETDAPACPISLTQADILDCDIHNASVVVLNFTLQFIPRDQRCKLLRRIADGMLAGGILILSEKICFDDQKHDDLVQDLHHFFKASNGYSEMEIAQKRNALENVLLPETLEQHRQRLLDSGLQNPNVWFQCFNFASLIAFK